MRSLLSTRMHLDVQILFYALLAASSPVVLLATLVVLGTERGRVNGIVFSAAFVFGQAAGLGIPLLVGVAVTSKTSENGTLTASLELAVGVLMLFAAYRMRGPGPITAISDESRTAALLERLESVDPKAAFSIGVPFGVGAKRLVLAILAASTIALSASSRAVELSQGSVYVVIASLPVLLPVVVYVVVGPRAGQLLDVSKGWLIANQRRVTFYLALLFGLLFAVYGVVALVS